ncbi:PAS domain S-box protein [Bradyrhizobium sp. UFLA05-112]
MVLQSLNVANSDGGSQVLWRDSERVFHRGWRSDEDGKRREVLIAVPATDHPSRSSLERLRHEYELKDELDATWAVRPLDLVNDAGRTMLVLEDAGGVPLEQLLDVPLEAGRFLHLAIAISQALGKLHQRGLVHKDIKPANILFNDATGEVRLTGFGIATRFARERQSPHPLETIAGTLAYMAPEQTGRMNRSIDSRSDLYALGVTFYQMLTGALPFAAAEPMEWVHCHVARRPVPPAERLKEIPGAISAIVMKLLAKRAEDRYQTAAGLESDLRSCLIEWTSHGRIDDFPLGERDTSDRLVIPEKLYGRRREVETLFAAFDRVVNGGPPELVLVYGYSGVGKSSVVNELQPVLVPPRGLFAAGKFDQYKRDIPYSTLAQAFQTLIRPLLGKSEADLAPWRDALREALGQNAGLIADLVPELKLIIGEPPPVLELPPQDAQRRFQVVFRQFIGVFARPEHPLALFLDDLQWLDAATLDLLDDLLNRSDLRNLLLVGAFRDNEVTASHPLIRKLEVIRGTGRVQDIKLAPLTTNDLGKLVADSLRCDVEQGDALTGLVHAKTDGNPFFVIQFLHVLADEGLLAFDHEQACWSWDLEGIHAKRYTDNVVELLAGKLTRLPLGTQEALRQLACLGHVADVAMLSTIMATTEEKVHAALWEARSQQLLDHVGRSYKFFHDRVQEAAYALIPETSRAEAHLTIGRLLLAQTPPEKYDEAIFEIVNQFNRAGPLIRAHEEREQLAELNLAAGKRAMAASAYASALTYLTAGAALLPEDAWERRQELTFQLELQSADCEIGMGPLQAAEQRLVALAMRAVGTVQRCVVARRRAHLYMMLNAHEQGVEIALECLRYVGINWSTHPTEAETRAEYEQFWSRLGNRAIEDLVDLPLMQDPEGLATIELVTALHSPACYTDLNLFALAICRAANLTLERGNSELAPYNYAAMSLIASARFGHYDRGYRLGRMGCDLLERRGWHHFGGRTYFVFATLLPWTRPFGDAIDPARRAFQMAQEHGDPLYAAVTSRALNSVFLALGHPLDQVEHEANYGLEFSRRFGFYLDRISAPLALVRTLRGETTKFGSLDDGRFSERAFEEQPTQPFQDCYYWIRKLQARFFAEDYVSAIDAVEKVEAWYARLDTLSLFMLEEEEYHFYAALARAALYEPIGPDPYDNHRERLKRHERQLRAWAVNCPQNFEDRAALVGAEIARIEGRPLDAMELYERAIYSARANGFVQNEAIANELAARFYTKRRFEKIARVYLRDARHCYLRWGAHGKVRQLDELHPWLRQDERAPAPASTIEAPVEHLDLATMIGASQALSSEMVLEKLVDRLLRAALEHAGAERGLLIIPRGDVLQIEADAFASGENVTVHLRNSPDEAASFPESLVRYGTRTHERLILNDASSQNAFSADPYIVRSSPRSILCLPLISQDKLIGILYLENNLAPNVFTPDRVTLLEVLASQAAISLENSRLYRDLADREAKIRRLVDSNIIGIFFARQGRIVEANDAFLRILGYDREDMDGGRVHWADLSPPEWRERDLLTRELLDSTGIVPPFEKEYFRKDGSRVPVLVGAALVTKGAEEGFAFVLDLTERKRAEQALQLQATLDSIPAMAWRAGADGSTDYINKRWLDYTGVSLDQALGWQWLDLIHPDDAEHLHDCWLRVFASKEPGEAEARMRGSDGSYRWFLIRAEPLRDDTGSIVAWYGTNTDIQDLKAAESALRRSEAELADIRRVRQTLDSIPAAAWRARADGFTEYVNKRWLDYMGFSLDQALGWGWLASIHPDDVEHLHDCWLRVFASEEAGEAEARMRSSDGSYRRFLIRAEPLRDDTGALVAWYGTNTDIEDRTQALARLQQMQSDFAHINRVSMMGELAASLSHEILHPIATARNNARAGIRFMEMNPPNLDEAREAFGCVVRDADRATDIVGRMRDHVKKAPPQKKRFDLNAAIDEVLVLAQSVTQRNGVSVQTRLADGLLPILGDRIQLQQVLLNLILNAAEAMGSVEAGARELMISTEQDEAGALVAVRDSGPGIDPADLDRVFDAFYTTKSSGTGMGLSICRSIIQAHGGKLWVEASEPRGAVFQFTLPAAREDS